MESTRRFIMTLFVMRRGNRLYIVLSLTIATLLVTKHVYEKSFWLPSGLLTGSNETGKRQTRYFGLSSAPGDSWKNPGTPKSDDVMRFEEGQAFCSMYSSAYKELIWPDTPADFNDWTYKKKRKCPKFEITEKIANTTRIKYRLNCFDKRPKLVSYFTNQSDDIQSMELNNTCLSSFTELCCNDDRGIPNIVHYVWYFKREMDFSMFLSILSAIRYIRPCLILIHGEYLPVGKYWDYIVRIYPNLIHIKRPRPLYMSGKKISLHEHSGDILRLEALLGLGGIYFDHDTVALRDLEPLRDYSVTLCNQSDGFLLNSFIMSKRNATFVQLWIDGYRKDYRNGSYVYNSMFYNNYLAHNRTDLIHIENGTLCATRELLNRPITSQLTYDWSKLFGYHLHSRTIHFQWHENMVNNFNTTIGAMARHIMYGNKELCANL